jgi:hypothetical protein
VGPFGQRVVRTVSHACIELHVVCGDVVAEHLDRSEVVTIVGTGALVGVERDQAVVVDTIAIGIA